MKKLLCLLMISGLSWTNGRASAAEPALDLAQPAADLGGLNFGLGSLPLTSEAQTRSISPENPTGGKGAGAMMIPRVGDPEQPFTQFAYLGRGWKTRPFVNLKAGESRTLMDVSGPGIIEHMWIVANEPQWQSCILRFYWDDEKTPAVESPLSDFFAVGHGRFAAVNSLPVIVNTKSAFNCFWPMPFRGHARIVLSNEGKTDVRLLTYQITYALGAVPANAAYFHARYRHAFTAAENPYVILEGIKGRGQYVGTFLAWSQMSDGWFGEGEIKFYLDGDTEFPTICGTGTEDYFLSSYGFSKTYSTPFVGVTLREGPTVDLPDRGAGTQWSMYRWHIMDPIRFQRDLRVTIQALGWEAHKIVKKNDEISSVAYWYQSP